MAICSTCVATGATFDKRRPPTIWQTALTILFKSTRVPRSWSFYSPQSRNDRAPEHRQARALPLVALLPLTRIPRLDKGDIVFRRVWRGDAGGARSVSDRWIVIPLTVSVRATEADILRPGYRITSSARCRTDCGIVTPNARATSRLISNSNWVGCSTGRSAGFAPRRIRSTKWARRRSCSACVAE